MDSLKSAWTTLDTKRRVIAIIASLAVFGAVLMLARGTSGGNMGLLYSGLEPQAAGEVVQALEQRGVAHEVRGSGIFVPDGMRDSLRMTLAGEGLPANSSQGYELLDSLTGFGTTAQMFDAAYWRAKEGELARTILASQDVRAARVHISTPSSSPFQRNQTPTAAVTVGTASGVVTPAQARAFRYLVASAVQGLAPGDVAVIDGEGNLVAESDAATQPGGDGRAEALKARAERLLEARVGPGNAIVEVSIETVTETESIVERRLDPESRVAISTDIEERTASDTGNAGAVTVASNLPDGDAVQGEGGPSNQSSETRALTNYDLSETSREILRAPGDVRRLTVAVLVNEPAIPEGGQPVLRGEEELQALGALVASAVGLNDERGDVLTIRSMTFEPVPLLGTEAAVAEAQGLDLMSLIQLAVLALVALVLGLFVVRPILRQSNGTMSLPAPEQSGELDLSGPLGEEMDFPVFEGFGEALAEEDPADPISRLRRLIDERQDDTIRILQSWVEDPDRKQEV